MEVGGKEEVGRLDGEGGLQVQIPAPPQTLTVYSERQLDTPMLPSADLFQNQEVPKCGLWPFIINNHQMPQCRPSALENLGWGTMVYALKSLQVIVTQAPV